MISIGEFQVGVIPPESTIFQGPGLLFPEFLKQKEDEILIRLLDDIIYRDIALRHGIRQYELVRRLAIYLTSQTGKLYSMNKLRKNFGVGSVRSISDYIGFFEDCYLMFSVPIFSFSIKKQLVNPVPTA